MVGSLGYRCGRPAVSGSQGVCTPTSCDPRDSLFRIDKALVMGHAKKSGFIDCGATVSADAEERFPLPLAGEGGERSKPGEGVAQATGRRSGGVSLWVIPPGGKDPSADAGGSPMPPHPPFGHLLARWGRRDGIRSAAVTDRSPLPCRVRRAGRKGYPTLSCDKVTRKDRGSVSLRSCGERPYFQYHLARLLQLRGGLEGDGGKNPGFSGSAFR